jgi:nucleotide-binding universal stress UspA family protein
MNGKSSKYVIVGVRPDDEVSLASRAARFAQRFDAELVCATVDTSRRVVEERPDGSVVTLPDPAHGLATPDVVYVAEYSESDLRVEDFDEELRARIAAALDPLQVRWSTRALAGGHPADALARLAEKIDAEMIIVGTRKPNFGGTLREFINGSVATRLAHRQHRPVVVIPRRPVRNGERLPWEGLDDI